MTYTHKVDVHCMAGIVGHPFRADSSSLIKDEWGLRITWNSAHSNPFVASLEVHPSHAVIQGRGSQLPIEPISHLHLNGLIALDDASASVSFLIGENNEEVAVPRVDQVEP